VTYSVSRPMSRSSECPVPLEPWRENFAPLYIAKFSRPAGKEAFFPPGILPRRGIAVRIAMTLDLDIGLAESGSDRIFLALHASIRCPVPAPVPGVRSHGSRTGRDRIFSALRTFGSFSGPDLDRGIRFRWGLWTRRGGHPIVRLLAGRPSPRCDVFPGTSQPRLWPTTPFVRS
jgi:hypothetical protein